MKAYEISLEVSGPMAMFARPDTGGTPTSYPAPTYSACKGILESIAWLKDGSAWMSPTRVEICKPVTDTNGGGDVFYQPYTTNYRGPLRKSNQLRENTSFQLVATTLRDVCYRIYGEVEGETRHPVRGNNPRHYLQSLFNRRLRQGRCHRTPCLGWSEFIADYWGPFRSDKYEVDAALNLTIPSMLFEVWDRRTNGSYEPSFRQNVQVTGGVLTYAQ